MDELYSLGLIEAVRRLSSGEMTSEAYTRSLLARIDQLEQRVQAWQSLNKERALELAREADRRILAGRTPGAPPRARLPHRPTPRLLSRLLAVVAVLLGTLLAGPAPAARASVTLTRVSDCGTNPGALTL